MQTREEVIVQKQKTVETLVEKIKETDALFFADFRGLDVSQLQALRSELRDGEAVYKIVKNSLIQRAFNELSLSCPEEMLKGPTALVLSTKDCPSIASKLVKFIKANEAAADIKGGILDGEYISASNVKALAKLPSKEMLIGQFVGGLQSIISRFVMSLSSPTRGLVYTLEQIKNNKNN